MSVPDPFAEIANDAGTGVLPETTVLGVRPAPITANQTPDLTVPTLDAGNVPGLPAIQAAPPGTKQYPRKISLIVAGDSGQNGTELGVLRIVFRVFRGDFQNPNTADIRVYNLSDKTANQFAQAEFTQLALQAGYEGNFGLVFRGTIVQARVGRENQTDSYVDITAADGDEAYNFSTMALSLAAGSKPADDVAAFLKSMAIAGVTQGYTPQLNGSGRVRGRVFWGCTKNELRDFAQNNDVLWSIQDGKLTLIPQSNYIPGEPIPLSVNTGLIGVPEQTQNGVNVKCLLNPSIKIGQTIQISGTINQFRLGTDLISGKDNPLIQQSNRLNGAGLYYVMVADHSGDTRGNEWYSRLTCLAVDATVPTGFGESVIVQGTVQVPTKPNSGPVAQN